MQEMHEGLKSPPFAAFDALRLQVLQRDWLSSNHIVFFDPPGLSASVVDTGYSSHAPHTLAVLEAALSGASLTRIFNTHLHSDHCGGNHVLQKRWPEVRTWVPQAAFAKAQAWDEERLTYRLTGQTCDPFQVDEPLRPGTTVELGGRPWQVLSAGGHDPDAVVLFEPTQRVLISGDALWRNKVAVIFPELDGENGFGPALATLDLIESLNPAVVIPGHGEPFTEVTDALKISRLRLCKLQANPEQHARHALRVLMVFHLMEHRGRRFDDLCAWMVNSPLAQRQAVRRLMGAEPQEFVPHIVQSLLDDGVVHREGAEVRLS